MPAPCPVTVLPGPQDWRPEAETASCDIAPGVYMLLHNGKVAYVGQTSHFLLRLSQHRAEGLKQFDCALFYHMPGSNESDRLWVEGATICAYQPPLNRAWHVGFAHGTAWEIGFGRRGQRRRRK